MLTRIPVGQLRLGMFVHSMECSWLDSPFWRSKFLLTDRADLDLLMTSAVAMVVIDPGKGIGIAVDTVPDAIDVAAPSADVEPIIVERRAVSRPRVRRPDEIERARETVERSKLAVMRMFGEARLGQAVQLTEAAPLVEEIAASMERDRSAMLNVTRLKTRHEYTYLHSVAVCALMMNFARQLGMPEDQVRELGIGGLLHDIGKMAMPGDVLDKPGALDPAEERVIRSHPEKGHALLLKSADVGETTLDVSLHHHERIDGRGYPHGLKGDAISLVARMGAICDVYDAITSIRPYKRPWSPNEALQRMLSWEGHFDQRLLQAFIASIGIFPLGGLVRLRSNRLGLVVAADERNPATPLVRAFYDIPAALFVAFDDVATCNAGASDPILRGERGDRWFGGGWAEIAERVTRGAPIPPVGIPPPPRVRGLTAPPATSEGARP